jgi:hypothetical protein
MLQVYCRIELPKPTLRKNNFLFLQNRDSTENLFSARIADWQPTLITDRAYKIAAERFTQGVTGTIFKGEARVGMRIKDLVKLIKTH